MRLYAGDGLYSAGHFVPKIQNASILNSIKKRVILLIVLGIFSLISTQASAISHTLTITSSGAESIDVIGRDNGTSIGVDNINVATTCRYGYNFTISTSVNNNNLYLNGNSSNNASGAYFTPADGTTALSNSTNKWGYYYDSSAPTTDPTSSNIFSAVPALNSTPAIIKSASATPSASDISDNFNLYYGVSSSTNLVPGTYRMIPDTNNNNNPGTIIYQATMAENCIPYTIQFNPTSTASGSSISGTGTMSPQEAYSGDTINLSPMSFTPPSGYEFKEWNTAQDGSGDSYSDEAEIQDLASPGQTITLYAQWWQPVFLYDAVANLTRGTLASNNIALSDAITTPTSTNKTQDTSNSGVFTYDPAVYGVSSDASNDYPIYFYRGILETNPATYGAGGSANAYPNYVRLSNNTCWRIIRTTGSGGVKMIYGGTWNNSTCAKPESLIGVGLQSFAAQGSSTYSSDWGKNIAYVGYTYNDSVTDSTSPTSVDVVFGSNSNPALNNTRSNIKTFIEDNWYANNMTQYTDKLEASAGYCNDRTAYTSLSINPTAMTSIIPYSTSGATMYFGTRERVSISGVPTLNCPRNIVDLYRYVPNSQGLSNELKYPTAPITGDESAFAGSGYVGNSSPTRSTWVAFLGTYSDGEETILSPSERSSNGQSNILYKTGGSLNTKFASLEHHVRPAISFKHATYIYSGSGTATDPWIIEEEGPPTTINLYNAVAEQSKGTQSRTNLQTTISTSNSGVYEYNSSVFGTDTDATKQDNTKAKIYYYRGILDNSFTTSTYGSSGDGELSPNYVILSPTGEKGTTDTCWRIIRTTGSGGVKMIYNGRWTGSTCANAQTNAQTGTSYYNSNGSTAARRIALAGYTYNSYGSSTSTTNTAVDTLFGSNTNYSGNTNSSVIKGNVDSWYNNNLSNYTSILEPNAGFCNDRSVYTNTAGTTAATQLRPTGSNTANGTTAYFGAYSRNNYNSSTRIPSLACPRNAADVYSTSTASAGNKQLSVPAALITADELSFAGAGAQTANQGSTFSTSSFIRSGSNFWTMTPSSRTTSNSRATLMYYSSGTNTYLSSISMYNNYGVRPVISLKEGAEAVSGTGTAADPWVVEAP